MLKTDHCKHLHNFYQLAIDFNPTFEEKPNLFKDYIKNEPVEKFYNPSYFDSFFISWLGHTKEKPINEGSELFKFLVSIQKISMTHLQGKAGICEKEKAMMYGVYKGLVSDLEGIKELVEKIWIDKKEYLQVVVYIKKKKEDSSYDGYYITSECLTKIENSEESYIIFNNDSTKSLEEIMNIIKPHYDVGILEGKKCPVQIISVCQERQKVAIELFNNYIQQLSKDINQEEKISAICYLCRELEQLHLFSDGNGRSMFILANALLCWNGLKPFYPKNMCIFDANSMKTMIQEVIEGQKRFELLFSSKEKLDKELQAYLATIQNLIQLVEKKFSTDPTITEPLRMRDFDLLLRRSSMRQETKELLEFLLNNLSVLNIDLFSEGKESGSALDVANKYKNTLAKDLLQKAMKELPQQEQNCPLIE